jgi:hypothetical protein
VGGAEAIISHLITAGKGLPCTHPWDQTTHGTAYGMVAQSSSRVLTSKRVPAPMS